jgi:hypothetical protein
MIIAFDSKLTGLAVRGRVERRITDRNQLKHLADKRLTDDDVAQRIQRSSLVLRKFGFIPRDFDLQKFAVELTVDEVAGYYDRRKTECQAILLRGEVLFIEVDAKALNPLKTTSIHNAARRVESCATNPIRGGPARKPT